MERLFAIVRGIFGLIPLVVEGFQAIEKAFPDASFDQKLEQVIGVLKGAYTAEQGIAVEFEALVPGLTSLANALFNKAPAVPPTAS